MMRVVVGKSARLGASAQELRWESLAPGEILAMAGTSSLLGGSEIYLLVGALAGERGEEFLDSAGELVASPHTFVFEEEKLLKGPTTAVTKAGAKVEVAEVKKKAESFNMFGLATIFGMRDKKKLWIELNKAARAGTAPEAVAGMLHWKVRDMMQKGSTKYSKSELTTLSGELIALYHDSHRGAGDLGLLLERFALKL
ncbi:MAG TPA: hypothetical protein VG984_03610 [Candidatus Paceibacterota bacterium]|nr:hypothetical protein [Candidatus Paceibacterota bacterium]